MDLASCAGCKVGSDPSYSTAKPLDKRSDWIRWSLSDAEPRPGPFGLRAGGSGRSKHRGISLWSGLAHSLDVSSDETIPGSLWERTTQLTQGQAGQQLVGCGIPLDDLLVYNI